MLVYICPKYCIGYTYTKELLITYLKLILTECSIFYLAAFT